MTSTWREEMFLPVSFYNSKSMEVVKNSPQLSLYNSLFCPSMVTVYIIQTYFVTMANNFIVHIQGNKFSLTYLVVFDNPFNRRFFFLKLYLLLISYLKYSKKYNVNL